MNSGYTNWCKKTTRTDLKVETFWQVLSCAWGKTRVSKEKKKKEDNNVTNGKKILHSHVNMKVVLAVLPFTFETSYFADFKPFASLMRLFWTWKWQRLELNFKKVSKCFKCNCLSCHILLSFKTNSYVMQNVSSQPYLMVMWQDSCSHYCLVTKHNIYLSVWNWCLPNASVNLSSSFKRCPPIPRWCWRHQALRWGCDVIEWWCLVSLRHGSSLFQSKSNWGLVSSDRALLCLMISASFMCLYSAALICIFSGAAPFWPPCHLAQICEGFHWLLSFQEDVPLHEAVVCSPARAVRGAVLWLEFIFESSLRVLQCGQDTSYSQTLGSPTFFSFGNNGVVCIHICCDIIFIPFPTTLP